MNTTGAKMGWVRMTAGLLCLAACAGCGGSKTRPGESMENQPWEVRLESPLDTVTVTQDVVSSNPESTDPGAIPEAPVVVEETSGRLDRDPETDAGNTIPDPARFTPGWRVQVFASSSMVSADNLAQKVRRRILEPVYVEYQPPLYKVRVGDFYTKGEAQSMATRVRAEGFDAWVVETLVMKPKP